jgi:hypothetical protein
VSDLVIPPEILRQCKGVLHHLSKSHVDPTDDNDAKGALMVYAGALQAGRECSDLTPIFIGMHRDAPLSPMKRVLGCTTPMKNVAMAPMAPMHLVEQIRAMQAGGPRGSLTPLAASPDPLGESLCKLSAGNRIINSVGTPLTLDPCGPQVYGGVPLTIAHRSPGFTYGFYPLGTLLPGTRGGGALPAGTLERTIDLWSAKDEDLIPASVDPLTQVRSYL